MIPRISSLNRSLLQLRTTTKILIITPKRIRRSLLKPANPLPKKHPHHLKPRMLKLVNLQSKRQLLKKKYLPKRRKHNPKKLVQWKPKSRKKNSKSNQLLKSKARKIKRKNRQQRSKNNKRRYKLWKRKHKRNQKKHPKERIRR
jgi:hypothetical protein